MGGLLHRLVRPQSLQDHGGPLRVAREGFRENSERHTDLLGTGGRREKA